MALTVLSVLVWVRQTPLLLVMVWRGLFPVGLPGENLPNAHSFSFLLQSGKKNQFLTKHPKLQTLKILHPSIYYFRLFFFFFCLSSCGKTSHQSQRMFDCMVCMGGGDCARKFWSWCRLQAEVEKGKKSSGGQFAANQFSRRVFSPWRWRRTWRK